MLFFTLLTSVFCFPNNKCINPSKTVLIDLFNTWNKALQSNNPEKVLDLYSKKSVLLATLENEPLNTYIKKLHYFEEFLLKNPIGTLITTYTNTDTITPYIDGTYNFNINVFNDNCAPIKCGNITNICTGNCRIDVKARFTYIYICEERKWKIQHHHSSKYPNM
jgi:hypothetical protein